MGISSGTGAVGFMPVGVVVPFAGSSSPAGWQLCYGQAISRTTYAGLFSTIGTTYGSGDGSTTFNVPDLRGRAVAGVDNMGGTDAGRLSISNTLGTATGAETHTLSSAEMPSHRHDIQRSNIAAQYVYPDASPVYRINADSGATITSTQNTGGGGAHNNMQPTIVLNYIIKAA